jgi:succinyl-CoA synthetase beta subunit
VPQPATLLRAHRRGQYIPKIQIGWQKHVLKDQSLMGEFGVLGNVMVVNNYQSFSELSFSLLNVRNTKVESH